MKIQSGDGKTLYEDSSETILETVAAALGAQADLGGADLRGADLDGADLYRANLYGANLYRAYLRWANLYGADLYGANLYRANLRMANLYRADLRGANLQGAHLCEANLRMANLYRANFWEANLRWANLYGADLYGAHLGSPGKTTISWRDHTLLSEILFRAAGHDVARQMLAGFVRLRTDLCWENFLTMEIQHSNWALDELAKWVCEGDGAPECVRERVKK